MLNRWSLGAFVIGLGGVAATPALGYPFDDPFTGSVDLEVVQMDLAGNTPIGSISATLDAATAGALNVTPGRIVDQGGFTIDYVLAVDGGSSALLTDRGFRLTAAGDDPGNAGFNPNYPLDPQDPLPPTDGIGPGASNGSGDSNFQTTGQLVDTGLGLFLQAERILLLDVIGRSPIPGGERTTYNAEMTLVGTFSGFPVILGMGGTLTIDTVPEPASLVLLAVGGLPLVRRRRRGR